MRFFLKISCVTLALCSLSNAGISDSPVRLEVFRHDLVNNQTFLVLGFNRDDVEISMNGETAERLDNGLFSVAYGQEEADWDGELDIKKRFVEIVVGARREQIVIHRQSAAELQDAYNFEKRDGYSIVAGATFNLSYGDKTYEHAFNRDGGFLPDIEKVSLPETPEELKVAASISAWLDSENLTYSPSRAPAEHVRWDERMDALRTGNDGLQCGDYRNVLTSIAIEAGINLRWIGLLSFSVDGLDDAVPYSHAALEVMTEQHGWVFYDPWHNLAFREGKNWLSTVDIRDGYGHPVSVLPNWSRSGRRGLGAERKTESWLITWPSMESYRGYFGVVETINLSY